MKNKILLILLFLISNELQSQDIKNNLHFNISYFGILGTHPGIKLGVQYPLTTFEVNETNTNLNEIIGASSLIIYFHRRNQLGMGVNFELGFRNRQAEKTNKEIMIGMGYLRTLIPAPVYDFDKKNNLGPKVLVGTNHFIKTVSLGLGKSLDGHLHSDFWMIKPTLFHLKPYNTGTSLNFALDAGYYFK